jgi:integrase
MPRGLYRSLECPDAPVHPPYTRAVRILMLTGQRVEEIAALHVDQWDAKERIIDWSKTKNSRPHAVPVPALAAELIESIKPNRFGWFFPVGKRSVEIGQPRNTLQLYVAAARSRCYSGCDEPRSSTDMENFSWQSRCAEGNPGSPAEPHAAGRQL